MFGYDYSSYDATSDESFYEHIGFEASFNIDLAAGYQAFFQWITKDKENLLVINPNIFVEVSTRNWIAFKLFFIEWWFRFDITGYKFTPVDYQALWSLDDYKSYCHSVSWVQDVFDFELRVE
jgi:hypothetical protein